MIGPMSIDREVRHKIAEPEEFPNHANEVTLIEYDNYHVTIYPAIRGFTHQGGQVMMLPIEHNGCSMRIADVNEIEEGSIDRAFVCLDDGERYKAFMTGALKVAQTFWNAADAGQPAETVDFILGVMQLLTDVPSSVVPDGKHREAGM